MSISISYKTLLRTFTIAVFIYYVHSTKSAMRIIDSSITMINQRKRNYVKVRRWFAIMFCKYNVSLDTVLQIQRALRYFTLFLELEYVKENIHHVLSVNEYKDAFY